MTGWPCSTCCARRGAEGDTDFLREGVRILAEAAMEAEVTELTGVPYGERAPDRRLTSRNGYRERRWDTRVGTIGLAIPKVRDGSYFPSLLEPRRRAERALLAVVQEAYVAGVSTRRVEDLVEALGIAGISRSEVSRICATLDRKPSSAPLGRSPSRDDHRRYAPGWAAVGPSRKGSLAPARDPCGGSPAPMTVPKRGPFGHVALPRDANLSLSDCRHCAVTHRHRPRREVPMSTEASRRQLRSQHAAVYDASQAADPHNCRPIVLQRGTIRASRCARQAFTRVLNPDSADARFRPRQRLASSAAFASLSARDPWRPDDGAIRGPICP